MSWCRILETPKLVVTVAEDFGVELEVFLAVEIIGQLKHLPGNLWSPASRCIELCCY